MSTLASQVLMVRPSRFRANPQTLGSNHFQQPVPDAGAHHTLLAQQAFDGYVAALRAAGVRVQVFAQARPDTPDALFPNNWFSTHADGTLVLYPMAAANRRLERRDDIVACLQQQGVGRTLLDLSAHEDQGQYLEGTGAIVFDHAARRAWLCRSGRSQPALLRPLAARLGYQCEVFDAVDAAGRAIYHSNVMMAIGPGFAVVCLPAIADVGERQRVRSRLRRDGKTVISISQAQMASFCGNIIALRGGDGGTVIAMSSRAWSAFTPAQQATLAAHGRIVHAPLDIIEDLGGGGARCMVAEVFSPDAPAHCSAAGRVAAIAG